MKNKFLGGAVLSLALTGVLFLGFWPGPKPATEEQPQGVALPAAGTANAVSAKGVGVARPTPPGAKTGAEHFWNATPAEAGFAEFANWTRRHAAAPDAAAKAALEAEGVRLARARLTAMADLIQTDPERALELAVPFGVRQDLPGSVTALLEEKVNARGNLAVLGVFPGGLDQQLPPVLRTVSINGEEYRAYTYGRGDNFMTRDDVPLNGIAAPASAATRSPANELIKPAKIIALSESPARILDPAEVYALAGRRVEEPVCSVSGELAGSKAEETVVELGGDLHSFCGKVHAQDWADARIAAAGVFDPGGGFSVPTAESSYTEGRKRMLCLRPYWSDYPITSGLTTNDALTHWVNFSNYMFQMSYGKLVFAPLGQGSDISADLLIPGSVDDYISGLGNSATDLWKAVRDVASTNYGYDLSQYDFIYYCTRGKPSASYAGLGFVGGVGFHLANGYFDAAVSSHEFGHNLGLNHANFWSTSPQSIIGSGQNNEYGDNNDPMGGGGNPNQFNSRYKNYLGWITNADIVTVSAPAGARYRLYCFDLDHSTVGTRGLKFTYSGNRSYWLQFRQRKSNRALQNGVQLLWTDSGNGSSHLLDVRLRGSASDNAVVIGRTFSDTTRNFHFTPVGKGNTYPESMDVVVYTGAQPTNLPPVATLAASKLQANAGEPITFTASASDPNNDTLAYYWEFGDSSDSYSIDNSPVQNKTFTSTGEYAVRCVVSDMRGGTAQHTLIVRVGNPTTFRISGHVVDDKNRPLPGIRVSSGSRSVFTDSDGSYIIPGLSAGSYNITAIETVSGALSFVNPYFNNPVTVGPDFTTADFVGITGSLTIYSPLVAKTTSGWKYHDKGQDLGTAWQGSGYIDSGWSNGVAPLGYPSGSPISTAISFGADSNNKHPTYYFRKTFNVVDPGVFTNLLLETLRDDGCAVYLNGVEVFRDNLVPSAPYGTFATDNSGASAYTQTTLPISAIIPGNNTLAVEVHQVNATSSDVVMDAALSGLSASNVSGLNIVYLSAPEDTASFASPANIALAANVFSLGAVSLVEFYANGVKIGDDNSAPFGMVWNNPAGGSHVLRSVATIGSLAVTSPPVTINVGELAAITFVPPGSNWRYLSTSVAAPATWMNRGFNDGSWPAGDAKLGASAPGVVTTINIGPSGNRYPTIYFRRNFVVEDPAGLTNLVLTLQRDDGAVVYLNGAEVVRENITSGVAVTYSTLATNSPDNGANSYTFSLPVSSLIPGSNTVAVEVHQSALNSSDLAFDLALTASVVTNRARGCWVVAPEADTTVPLGGALTLGAEGVAGGLLSVSKMEFFVDGAKIGEDSVPPYAISFIFNIPGTHAVTAAAIDSLGAAIPSAPVNITVLPLTNTAFISFGDVWKYQDDGLNLGTNWTARTYDDRLWMAGPARLGYGGDGELTTLRFGTNAGVKFITTYFRKTFTGVNPGLFNALHLRLIRDDGAAVYLNGREIYRNNLQPGPVSWNSLASATADGASETTPIDVFLPTNGLVSGSNVLAVEIHQAAVNSSDLGFDLALTGRRATTSTSGVFITSPPAAAHYNTPAVVGLSSFVMPEGGPGAESAVLVEYFANGSKVGQSTNPPFAASWSGAANGAYSIVAIATIDGTVQRTSAPVSITVTAPPQTIAPVFQTIVPPGSSWKYWDSATAAGTGWQKPGFDDAAWPSANARFGWGLDGEVTLLNESRVTHYFRRWFTLANLGQWSELFFYLQRDDGAVVYLNGVEIFRNNMPAGTVSGSTLASAAVNTPDETIWLESILNTPGSGLLASSNLIAVELHQSSASSSDASFDLALYSLGTTERRIYISAPSTNTPAQSTGSLLIEAGASAGTGLGVTKVEFYTNGVKLGESLAAPWRVNWSNPPFGTHVLLARMFDSAGGTQDSAPVSITVTRELFTTTLIPANSVWKYRDLHQDLGTNWAQPAFNDSAWAMGQARLGFGGDGEVTLLAGQPVITYYFRKTFVTTPGLVYTNLNFRLVRDDGAVVWLNGREVYRSNMGGGAIVYTTRPSGAVGNADEQTFFPTNIVITNLPPGTNLVAVEVHQNDSTSSDVGFNLELIASGYVENIAPPLLAIVLDGGAVELSWPSTFTGWQVHSAPTVTTPPAQWMPVGTPAVLSGNRYVVTVPPTGGWQFFKLQRP